MTTPVVPVWDGTVEWLAEAARMRLGLPPTDPDIPYLLLLSQSVMTQIITFLDGKPGWVPAVQVPAPITTASIQAVCEAYSRKDAKFGIYSAWSDEGVSNRISPDWLAGVYDAIRPYKQQWGVS